MKRRRRRGKSVRRKKCNKRDGTYLGWKGRKSEISDLYIQRAKRVSELMSFFCLGWLELKDEV